MLVIGGSRGIGAETARLLALAGHDVCFNYEKPPRCGCGAGAVSRAGRFARAGDSRRSRSGTMFLTQAVVAHWRASRREGAVVNVSSIAATLGALGEPGRPQRLASRIPTRRAAEAREIAEAIVWLLPDRASYVTGSVLKVAGGL